MKHIWGVSSQTISENVTLHLPQYEIPGKALNYSPSEVLLIQATARIQNLLFFLSQYMAKQYLHYKWPLGGK